jgi:hypothetical protein
MSMSLTSRARATEPGRPAEVDPSSAAMTHTMLRGIGIVMLLGIAVIHVVQLVPTFEQMPLLGVAYVILIISAVAVGVHLVRGAPSSVHQWLPVVGLGLAVIGGYAFTRMFSTPLDNQDVGNWACTLGMAALFVEALLVAIAAYAISHGRRLMLATASVASGTSHGISDEDGAARRRTAAWN